MYDLVSATVHSGSADGGHYVAYVRVRKKDESCPSDPEWVYVSDSRVKPTTFEKLQKAPVTNLIYVRRLGAYHSFFH